MAWDRVYVTLWYVFISLMIAFELYTLLDKRSSTPPLTHVLVAEAPPWLVIPFLVWLLLHFVVAYVKSGKVTFI